MNIAVTGGNGELGRYLVPYLLEQGHGVVSIDRSQADISFPPPLQAANYMTADTNSFGELVGCFHGCEAVIHLAAHRSPVNNPHHVVYAENTIGSYNVLQAAATLGIERVCLASSINALGGVFSRFPRYDYFPLDEQHPTYAEEPYSLSKWVLEQQADAFARRFSTMRLASLRFHWILDSRARAVEYAAAYPALVQRHLWAYTLLADAARACLLSLTADFTGHEAFYIVAPRTAVAEASATLAQRHYPETSLRSELTGNTGFFDCDKADRILDWQHEE